MPESITAELDRLEPRCSVDDGYDFDDAFPVTYPLSGEDAEAAVETASAGPISAALAALTTWVGVTHAVADTDDGPSRSGFWSAYSGQFLRQAIVGFAVGLVCNGLWGIPLYQVVDVNLALSLSFLVVFLGILGFVFFLELFYQMWRGALETLFYIATAIFLPFGAIVGYMIYGALGGGDVTSASFVYKIYVGLFADSYAYLASITGDILGAIKTQRTAEGELAPMVNMQLFMDWVPIAASVATVLNFVRDIMRPTAPARSHSSRRS